MARLHFVPLDDGGIITGKLGGSGWLFFVCMILMSFSIMSMIIFACGDRDDGSSSRKHKTVYTGYGANDGGGGGGHGHGHGGGCGGGGGGCGGGSGGGGCGGESNDQVSTWELENILLGNFE